MTLGQATAADIDGQVDAWVAVNRMLDQRRDELAERWYATTPDHVHLSGCGSVNYLSQTLAALLQPVACVPTSAGPGSALLSGRRWPILHPERTRLVVLSRSGETSELLRAVHGFRSAGGREVWCVTTRSGSSLASLADVVVATDEGYEPSVVQTRSFCSLLAMGQGLTRIVGRLPLPSPGAVAAAGAHVLGASDEGLAPLDVARFRRVVVLGTATGHGLAQEGQLLLNEVALTDSVAHQLLDFRHGPIAMVDADTLVVALVDPGTSDAELSVLNDVVTVGGTVLTISMGRPGPLGQPTIEVDPTGTGDLTQLLPPLQKLALLRARAAGIDPDQPRNLSAVVTLDPTR